MEENLKRIDELASYKYGDRGDVTISRQAVDVMKTLIKACKKASVKQPKIFPFSGGDGLQAEWEHDDVYIEFSADSNCVSVYIEGHEGKNSLTKQDADAITLCLNEWSKRKGWMNNV